MRATVLLADYANLTGDGKLNVMGVFRQINAVRFPCRHLSMYLVIKLTAGLMDELKGEHVLVTHLVDADGTVLHELEMPFEFPEGSSVRDSGLRPEVNFLFQIANLEFFSPGDYVWHVLVEDENVGRFEFYLNELPINGR